MTTEAPTTTDTWTVMTGGMRVAESVEVTGERSLNAVQPHQSSAKAAQTVQPHPSSAKAAQTVQPHPSSAKAAQTCFFFFFLTFFFENFFKQN